MKTIAALALVAALAVTAVGDEDREKSKITKAAEERANSFFLARKSKKIFHMAERDESGEKTVVVSKRFEVPGKRKRYERRNVTERRKTITKLYFREVNEKAVIKSWQSFLIPAVKDDIARDTILKLVRIDAEREYDLIKALESAGDYRDGDGPTFRVRAQGNLDAYRASCWPLAFVNVKHLRTVCSRSSVTMWHRASEVRIAVERVRVDKKTVFAPVESEKKLDKKLLKTFDSADVVTVWVRLGGKFYLSAAVGEGGSLALRAMEAEVLLKGPGMTADELVAQAHDGAAGEVKLGEVSDTGFLQRIVTNQEPNGEVVSAEICVGVNTLWLRVTDAPTIARMKKMRRDTELSFHGTGWVLSGDGRRHAVVQDATIK